MGKINDFKEFLTEEHYVDEYDKYTEEDVKPYTKSIENAKKLSDKQKEFGGVIGFRDDSGEADKYFIDLGYEIKRIKHSEFLEDKDLINDMNNRNKVNYVVSYLPEEDDEMELMGEKV